MFISKQSLESDIMSEGTQRVLDTACAVTAHTAELVKALLLLHKPSAYNVPGLS